MTFKKGEIIGGRYEIVEKLGEGTFGVTYQAVDTHSRNDPCVIKQLQFPDHSSSNGEKEKELFEREAKALHKIKNHRSSYLPQFYANFSEGGETYIVQEFIEGHNLREELNQKGRLSEEAVIKILRDGLEGLKFLHEQGMIHRDIKPDNLMRRTSDNSIVIIDLGAVKEKQESSEITTSQTKIGTPGYNPPEQDKGILIDSTDIYALGITAIEALAGKKACDIKNLQGDVQWTEDLKISPELKRLLERMVEDDHNKRYYGTANHALNDLAKLAITPQSALSPSSQKTDQFSSQTVSQMTQLLGKKQVIILILLVIGVASLVGFLVARQFSQNISQPQPDPLSNPSTPTPTPISTPFKITELASFSTPSLITALAITKDGKVAIFGHDDGSVSIWNIETGSKLKGFQVYPKTMKVTALTMNEDGSYLAVGNKTGNIQVWNLSDRQNPSKRYELNHQDEITALAMTAQGDILVSGGLVNKNKKIKVWELQATKWKLIDTLSVNQGINSLDINQDGSVIVAGDYQGTIIMWKLENNNQKNSQYLSNSRMIDKGFNPMYVSVNLDGQTMVSSFCNNNIILMKSIKTNLTKQEFKSNDNVCIVAMNPNGDLAAGLSEEGNLIIWDSLQLKEMAKILLFSTYQEPIESRFVNFSDEGKLLIVVVNSEVKTWSIIY